jgi:integrase
VVEVIDADPEARQRTVKVKVAAEYQPVSELKTPKSRRTLVLTPELVSRFRQHRVQQAEAQMAAGPLWQDHGLIFASEVGTPMDPDNFPHPFARLCERAGLSHWHPHELRHSRASLMLTQGTPLHVVAEVLGHASIAITKDVNGHLLQGDKAGGGGVDEPGAVRWLTCARGSQRDSQNDKKPVADRATGL